MDSSFLEILCCPATHQPVRWADTTVIENINASIAAGSVQNVAGTPVATTIPSGLVRDDGKILYPVRNGIPVLLVEEGIPL